jgi:hypothetical protein
MLKEYVIGSLQGKLAGQKCRFLARIGRATENLAGEAVVMTVIAAYGEELLGAVESQWNLRDRKPRELP